MDTSKVLLILCTLILIVCLTLATSTLMVFRNAIEENGVIQERATAIVGNLGGYVDALNKITEKDEIPVFGNTEKTQEEQYLICEIDGKIWVYTTDGYPIKNTGIDVISFPKEDRNTLRNGVICSDWKEVLQVLQDYGA